MGKGARRSRYESDGNRSFSCLKFTFLNHGDACRYCGHRPDHIFPSRSGTSQKSQTRKQQQRTPSPLFERPFLRSVFYSLIPSGALTLRRRLSCRALFLPFRHLHLHLHLRRDGRRSGQPARILSGPFTLGNFCRSSLMGLFCRSVQATC